jgi:twitching motility two-component system response regulator PilG
VSGNVPRSLSGLKILVVDDSKTIRRTAETLLSKEGCQVFTAIDGFDALSKSGLRAVLDEAVHER